MKIKFMMGAAGKPPPALLCRPSDGQLLVDASEDLIVGNALEEGVPWPWSNEVHLPPLLPDYDCFTSESCPVGFSLQGRANLVLLRGCLAPE